MAFVDRVGGAAQPSYARWITSVSFDPYNRRVISASRNGFVNLYSTIDTRDRFYINARSESEAICKDRNQRRVNTAVSDAFDVEAVIAGRPKRIDRLSTSALKVESSETVHANDWVYCMRQTASGPFLCATGCDVGMYHGRGHPYEVVLTEQPSRVRQQRAFRRRHWTR